MDAKAQTIRVQQVEDKDDVTTPLLPRKTPSEHTYISLSDVARLQTLSLYQKKCLVVDREMEAIGMGRYQWMIWSLCGVGYLIDLMWAMAFGLILGPLQQEFGFAGKQSGTIASTFSAGMTAGAAIWGILVDIVGRQWAFKLTTLCSSVFGIALATTNSYHSFLFLTALVGFGVGGNIPVDTMITLEFIPKNKRRLLPLLSVFQPVGVVVTTALAYVFIPTYSCSPNFSEHNPLPSCSLTPGLSAPACCERSNNTGWRLLIYTIGAVTLLGLFGRIALFQFRESPKFLIYRGRDQEAVTVLQQISEYNGRKSTITLADFQVLEVEHKSDLAESTSSSKTLEQKFNTELQRYGLLFSSLPMARLTILVFLTYICDYWGFSVAGNFLPVALAKKNASLNLSLTFTYKSYILIYLPGTLGVLLGVACYSLPHLGRKLTLTLSSLMMALSLFIFTTINTPTSNIAVNALEYFFQSMFNAVLYGWTPEAFSAEIRGTACGLASFWGRLAGIVSPLVAQRLLPQGMEVSGGDYDRILLMAGGVTLGCVLFTALLPMEKLKEEEEEE